jgi:hypothetical protein
MVVTSVRTCLLVARHVTCRDAAIWLRLGDKRTLPGHRKSVARDPCATSASISCRGSEAHFDPHQLAPLSS